MDPGDAMPVINWLQEQDMQLSSILVTHHHRDHSGGVEELLQRNPVPVFSHATIGSAQEIDLPDQHLKLNVMPIPGHTLDHLAFYNDEMLFCGDTLFGAGCGKVFEGSAEQMFVALNKLKNLPPQTKVYCGHEYTLANLKFALQVEPNNLAMQERLKEVEHLRSQNLPTLPSTIATELETNPFLRVATLKKFIEIRSWKDNFLLGSDPNLW